MPTPTSSSMTLKMPQLDSAIQPFGLKRPDGEPVGLDSLVEPGLLVLAMMEADTSPDPRLPMLRELGRSAVTYGGHLVVVSHGECGAGRQLEAAGIAQWLNDGGEAFQRLDLTERKLGRTRRQGGIFVIDGDLVLRFAFSTRNAEEWIPASFVISRLKRLNAAATPTESPEVSVPEEVEQRSQSAVDTEMDELVRQVGERLGMSAEELSRLTTASRFRDLGMAMVPNSIITKDGPLTDEEWTVIKQHPERSAEMLGAGASLEPVREVVRASHEHLDGSGYPRGLSGDDIPLGARILLACESYLAMTQERPYREMLGMRDAVEELRQYAGRIYDSRVVDALVERDRQIQRYLTDRRLNAPRALSRRPEASVDSCNSHGQAGGNVGDGYRNAAYSAGRQGEGHRRRAVHRRHEPHRHVARQVPVRRSPPRADREDRHRRGPRAARSVRRDHP